jgi:hypothetical protein
MNAEELEIVEDLSIAVSTTYVYILLFFTPILILMIALYIGIWELASFLDGLNNLVELPMLISILILGIPIHEILHLLPWIVMGKVRLSDVKLGFQLKTLTPYAHAKIPIRARVYQLGTFFPGLVLGILPYTIGLFNGDGLLTTLGLFFVFAAAGDFLVLWKTRGVGDDVLLFDHPSRVGCYVLRRPGGELG